MNTTKISAIIVLLLSFFVLPDTALAKYSGGSGTAGDPYQIATDDDLFALAANTGDYGAHIVLTADINLASDPCTSAIIAPDTNSASDNFQGTAFTGVFDGNSHTISNLTINTGGFWKDHLGLFGQLDSGGQVKNLGLKNVSITSGISSSYIGGLVGDNNSGVIINCYSSGAITSGTSSSALGGLTGNNRGTINNCYSTGTITSGNNSWAFGGLSGACYYHDINDCYSTSMVSGGNNAAYVGGLVGYKQSGTVSHCFATGDISCGTGSHEIGGLTGFNNSTITLCFATGKTNTASTSKNIGGLTGWNWDTISNCYSTGDVNSGSDSNGVGGLAGINLSGSTISYCYSAGDVNSGSGSVHLGGSAGINGGTISNCYFLNIEPNNDIGTALSAAQMKMQASFSGWDFNDVWRIRENTDYPRLNIHNYSGGQGTAADPYQIATVSDLLEMAANTNDYDRYFILVADINLADAGTFTAAVIAPDTDDSSEAFQGTAFTGVFDGNNRTISNLMIDTGGIQKDHFGLFGQIDSGGQVKNLGLINVGITGGIHSFYVGGLAGRNFGTISNCYLTGKVVCEVNSECVGGLAGWNAGNISICYSTGAVTDGNTIYNIGGLAGVNAGTISNCYSTSDVNTGSGSAIIGGLAGWNGGGTIDKCYACGNILGTGSSRGGLAGLDNVGGTISNCYFLNTEPNNNLGTPLTSSNMKKQSSFADWDFNDVWRIQEGISYPKLPYRIVTAGDLMAMAANTAGYNGYFVLTADINLASYDFTTAVIAPDSNNSNTNFDGNTFNGVFDGNSHTISNLTINTGGAGNDYLGLFGKTGSGSQIKNLGLKNVSITGGTFSYYVGGLAGHIGSGTNVGNCYSSGTIGSGASCHYIAGLAGDSDGNISNCWSGGAVNSGDSSEDLGGLVGLGGGTMSCSFSTADVNGGASCQYLGGLKARNWAGSGATIDKCYATGFIKAGNSSKYLGGLVGFDNAGPVSNCYSTGDVNSGNDSNDLGGLVGYNYQATITNCYSAGDVNNGSGSSDIGGLVGASYKGTINHCYYLDVSGPNDNNGTPLTDPNMKQQSSFVGWDFNGIWRIRESVDYPRLQISNYSGGSGSSDSPYLIATVDDLLKMAANVADYDASFLLVSNIDLGESGTFTNALIAPDEHPLTLAFDGTPFTGTFDGNSHTIKNLTINTGGAANNHLGLFGEINPGGQIKNLGLKNVNITSGDTARFLGGLVGVDFSGIISRCHSTGNVTGGNSAVWVGGLIGCDCNGSISSCYSTVAVTGGNSSACLGGLVGRNYGQCIISNCYSTGTVTGASSSSGLGGLSGDNDGNIIRNCYSTGAVTGGNGSWRLGGLLGENYADVNNCYSTGDVNSGTGSNHLGGLAGGNWVNISNCYSTGDVNSGSGSSYLGGLTGSNADTISHCYYLDVSGPNDNNGTPLTDPNMKKQGSFAGLDFNDTWWIIEKSTYPKLNWQLNINKCTASAGSKPDSDKVAFSGLMEADSNDFSDGNATVIVNSDDTVNPCILSFPIINGTTYKNGKYKYSGTENGIKKSFSYDTKTHKLAFSASNLDLSGLDCSVTARIDVGSFHGVTMLDESVVNGSRKPVPIKFMDGIENTLRVDKCTVKQSKSTNKDQLTASGGFSVENPDPNMANWVTQDLVITLGSQQFTVPKNNLKPGSGKFSCSNVKIANPAATASATFNFNLCSFTLTVKDANIPELSGNIKFGAAFADYNEVEQITF